MVLRCPGHVVQTAYDGPQALEAADHFRPEVVLLDIGLPTSMATKLPGDCGRVFREL